MNKIKSYQEFQIWLADRPQKLAEFLELVPPEVREGLDFSAHSLNVLEDWLHERYPDYQELTSTSFREQWIIEAAGYYVGEVFRRYIGGEWSVKLEDPTLVYWGTPIIVGFRGGVIGRLPPLPGPFVTTTIHRRVKGFLQQRLSSYTSKA